MYHVDANRPPEGEETTILDHSVFYTDLDAKNIMSQMYVGTEWNPPGREWDHSTVLDFFVQCLHNLCNVFDDGGVVTILLKGIKIFLSGRGVEISRKPNSDNPFNSFMILWSHPYAERVARMDSTW